MTIEMLPTILLFIATAPQFVFSEVIQAVNAAALIVKTGKSSDKRTTPAPHLTGGGVYSYTTLNTAISEQISLTEYDYSNFSNGTANQSLDEFSEHSYYQESVVPHVLKSVVLVAIILLAIFSNLLVVISVVRYHKLRHINNYFLVSLAVADLLVACFAMTFNATVEITGQWNFGYRICDLWNSLDVHFSTVSTLHLCCIAVDRYYAIVRPLKYTSYMTVKVAAMMIGVAWTAPTLISFLPIFLGWYTTSEHQQWREGHPNECIFKVNQPYAFISSTLTFWAPVSVMLIMYRRIYKEALRQKEAIRRSSVPSQQHLIVDSDSMRSRFHALQANGFKSKNKNKNKNNHSSSRQAPQPLPCTPPVLQPPMIMTSSPSEGNVNAQIPSLKTKTLLLKASECETKFDSETNGGSMAGTPPAPPPATPSGPPPPPIGSIEVTPTTTAGTAIIPCNSSAAASPVKTTTTGLTPTAALLGSVQRRLSMANSTVSEGLRERHRIHTSWRKEHKAFVTLGIVMGAFLLCWLPFFTWYLTVTICGDTYCPCPDVVVSILFWIGYFNSTLNPVIYVMTNRDFKDAFTDILRRIFCWCCPNKGCTCTGDAGNGPDCVGQSNVDFV